jgi:hypothetical protein
MVKFPTLNRQQPNINFTQPSAPVKETEVIGEVETPKSEQHPVEEDKEVEMDLNYMFNEINTSLQSMAKRVSVIETLLVKLMAN